MQLNWVFFYRFCGAHYFHILAFLTKVVPVVWLKVNPRMSWDVNLYSTEIPFPLSVTDCSKMLLSETDSQSFIEKNRICLALDNYWIFAVLQISDGVFISYFSFHTHPIVCQFFLKLGLKMQSLEGLSWLNGVPGSHYIMIIIFKFTL